jgi:hypothetical protein
MGLHLGSSIFLFFSFNLPPSGFLLGWCRQELVTSESQLQFSCQPDND